MDILVLDNRPFIIDLEKDELRQYNQPANTIAFRALQKQGSFFVLELNGAQFKMPQAVIQSAKDLSALARASINLRSQEENWGIYLGDEKTARRLSGELPHIDIKGTDFTVDWRLRQLRETAEPWKNISITDMELSENGEAYVFFYDTDAHTLFDFNGQVFEMPEHVVIAEIPNEIGLDPVAVAREYELGETGLLAQHPIAQKLTATIKPITGIGLEEFVAENIKRKEQQEPQRNSRGR
jgi:hypothetical protein